MNMGDSGCMWRCHGCYYDNNYDICPACINCGHVRCGYCAVDENPVKDAPNKPRRTKMWTCCVCYNDNRASAGGVCWNCSHYYQNSCCSQYYVYPQD